MDRVIKMNRVIKVDPFQNSAKNYAVLTKDIETIARERGVSVVEVMDDFISDLHNIKNEDYNKKVENIDLTGLTPNMINSIITYMNKMRKMYKEKETKARKEEQRREKKELNNSRTEEMESIWLQIQEDINMAVLTGEKGTEKEIIEKLILDINQRKSNYELDSKSKKHILKKLKGRLDEINRIEADRKRQEEEKEIQERAREEGRIKAEEAMKQIEAILERESMKGKIKNRANYLTRIRSAITGEDENVGINIKIAGVAEEQLLQIIDERIKTEKDKIYYEQVKSFTNNFQFLKDYPEIARAINGVRNEKFTDRQSYDRFYSLRKLLQREYDEKRGIDNLLESGMLDDIDTKILTERKDVIKKQLEKGTKTGEIK